MSLLPDEFKVRLPPIAEQASDLDPMVYARLYLPGTDWNWYVIGGEPCDEDYLLSCFFSGSGKNTFANILLSLIENLPGPEHQATVLDPDFPERRLTDVVPAPDD
jgi:hypothetical protein